MKCFFWKDGDFNTGVEVFILTKFAEIFEVDEKRLGVHLFDLKKLPLLRNLGVISEVWLPDEGFVALSMEKRLLPEIVELGNFKRRPDTAGKWIKDKAKRLGHKIFPTKINRLGYYE